MAKRRLWPAEAMFVVALVVGVASCSGGTDADDTAAASGDLESEIVAAVEPGDSTAPAPTTSAPPTTTTTTTTTTIPLSADDANDALGRGINFGNSLEAPRERDWGPGLDARYFALAADAGFDHVRLPVSWSEYADVDAPYTIPVDDDPSIDHPDYDSIFERVDWAIDQARANDLRIIVNVHHYDEIHDDPDRHADRLVALWEQIAPRYADQPDEVYFELFNEPHAVFSREPDRWNALVVELLAVIRETNPTRKVLVGPVAFNHISRLDQLVLPDDPYLIATVHLYEPFGFTHQGATWVEPNPPVGATWSPDAVALPDGVADWSWDTTSAVSNDDELRVEFARQWAGYSLNWNESVDPIELQIELRGDTTLRVACRVPGEDLLGITRVTATPEATAHTIDLRGCPPQATGIALMNETENLAPVFFGEFEVCTEARGCEDTIEAAGDAVRAWVAEAAAWGDENGVPVHLGEFGAYGADGRAPLDDRAEWTAAVVDAADEFGLSFAYWEFHAGYGVYDLEADAWVEPLRAALLDERGS